MARQRFLYKVYEQVRELAYNHVINSDFEQGIVQSNGGGVRNGSDMFGYDGSETIVPTKVTVAETADAPQENTQALSFNGVNTRGLYNTTGPFVLGEVSYNLTTDITLMVWASKTDWEVTTREAIWSNDYVGTATQGGIGLHINYTAGNLSAIAYIDGAWREASYALSNLAAGEHHIGFTFDDQFLRLYVDGVNVDTYDYGSATTITYGSNPDAPIGVGAQKQPDNGSVFNDPRLFPEAQKPHNNYFYGWLDDLMIANFAASADAFDYAFNNRVITFEDEVAIASGVDVYHFWQFNDPQNKGLSDGIQPVEMFFDNDSEELNGIEKRTAVKITTDTGGGSRQGLDLVSWIGITGGTTYMASAYVKTTAGESIRLQAALWGGGPADASVTVTASGEWQRLSVEVPTEAACYGITLDVTITNAAASNKIIYVDKLMLSDGDVLYDYFSEQTENSYKFQIGLAQLTTTQAEIDAGGIGVYTMVKADIRYLNYIKTLNPREVLSDYGEDQEINGLGGDFTLLLGRTSDNFGERDDISFGNLIEIVHYDSDDYPNGHTVFQGEIVDYDTTYGKGEGIGVVLRGIGWQLGQYVSEMGESFAIDLDEYSGTEYGFNDSSLSQRYIGQGFVVPAGVSQIKAIDVYMRADSNFINYRSRLSLWTHYSGAKSDGATSGIIYSPVRQKISEIQNTAHDWVRFEFAQPLQVFEGQQLWWTQLILTYQDTPYSHYVAGYNGSYNGGYMFRYQSGNVEHTSVDLMFRLVSEGGNTTAIFDQTDPSDMARKAIDDYNRQGGTLTYDDDSIQDTGLSVDYDFVSATTSEVLEKSLELIDIPGWYSFVNQSEKKYYLRHRDDGDLHTLLMGKHITETITFHKRTVNMVNVVYFTGGDPLGDGVNLFKKYVDQTSVDLYGRRLLVYTDNRVKKESTADTVVQSIFNNNSYPVIETDVSIPATLYDIWSVNVGDVVRFKNFDNNSASLFDVSEWDDAYFDFDVANPETYQFQIARLERNADSVRLTLSTVPPDVNRRTEQTKRNLDKAFTVDNPDTPS